VQALRCRPSGAASGSAADTLRDRLHKRRDVVGRLAFASVTALGAVLGGRRGAAARQGADACRFVGVTGGGVVRTPAGDATLVLFASRFVDGEGTPAEGKVRWLDPSFEGGMSLESSGPVIYETVADDERSREVRGIATVNGEFVAPFVLVVTDNSGEEAAALTPDRCRIQVGTLIDNPAAAATEGWGYAGEGDLVGGDLLLLTDT